jgi:CheY-like chemotaxis protein
MRRSSLLADRALVCDLPGVGNVRFSIVYADDDALVRDVVTQALVEEGVDVHACEGGAEALELCRQIEPDAVLLDLNMPDLDGLATARAIRRDPGLAHLRLIALTGRGTWELRRKAIEAGFDEFLVKPVPVATLIKALRPAA